MNIFLLISGPIGWAACLFIALAVVIIFLINFKLVRIIR